MSKTNRLDPSILTRNPDHLVPCVARTNVRIWLGLTGLPAVEVEREGEALLVRHLSTGGFLRFLYYEFGNRRRCRPPCFNQANWRRLVREPSMHVGEPTTLENVPPCTRMTCFCWITSGSPRVADQAV